MRVAEGHSRDSPSTSNMMDGPINVTMWPAPISTPLLLNGSSPPPLSHANYESIHFWTKKEWKTWPTQTTEGICANPYTSLIENKEGKSLDIKDIGPILQTAWNIWHEFCVHGIINPQTMWLSMPLSAKKTFRNEVM